MPNSGKPAFGQAARHAYCAPQNMCWQTAKSAPGRWSDSPDEPDHEQQNYGADRGGDKVPDEGAAAEGDVELIEDMEINQQPAADEGADDADDNVANDAKTRALDDLGRKPAGEEADQQDNDQALSLEHADKLPARRSSTAWGFSVTTPAAAIASGADIRRARRHVDGRAVPKR
jgi:hypothetical protein